MLSVMSSRSNQGGVAIHPSFVTSPSMQAVSRMKKGHARKSALFALATGIYTIKKPDPNFHWNDKRRFNNKKDTGTNSSP